MMIKKIKKNSVRTDWCTPEKYVDLARDMLRGRICLDPCSSPFSIVDAERAYMPPQDGLSLSWNFPNVFVNPPNSPYGTTRKWLSKCYDANVKCLSEVLAMVPVATNSTSWKMYVWGKASVCFLYEPRIRFLDRGESAGQGTPLPYSMVYWGNDTKRFREVFSGIGAILTVAPK